MMEEGGDKGGDRGTCIVANEANGKGGGKRGGIGGYRHWDEEICEEDLSLLPFFPFFPFFPLKPPISP